MKVFTGNGCLKQLLNEIKTRQYRKILVVTGKSSFDKSGLKEKLISEFQGSELTFFSEFSPNVKFEESYAGCEKIKSSDIKAVFAIGGGSVIDMGKTISLNPGSREGLRQMVLGQKEIHETLPFYCAPTTAGSGSEATHFAVIYMDGQKYSLAHEKLIPLGVAVDPELSVSMPPYLTACSGFDALSQAIESYWANGATEQSREYAARAISLILPALENAILSPAPESRQDMALGAHYAGKAINLSKTTAPHAFSYYLTSAYGIPHGHAVAIFTGLFFKINQGAIPSGLYKIMNCDSAEACYNLWYEMMDHCQLEYRMEKLGIPETECENIISYVNLERLKNNPVILDKEDLLTNLKKIYHSA
ncbi:phosphonoacetaldehyde reductase [Desulfovibrio sp. JC022]|uniref:phosphonoacetaldehyde reductase n=1 Tax=Desulfovibrio sp. JC022 TaxID=2593642 RepID=UPI0013D5B642|nr:phosphonoacetaldehyde reductase [Desulfovibrio sp. JC022]NDV23217.1 phosphonoacetaldehyde reductase [Desulfovibrio sp. JC022]